MVFSIESILHKKEFTKDDIVYLLSLKDENDRECLFAKAREIKEHYTGNKIFMRGLIEFSNICRKNCLYCGIRAGNSHTHRYIMSDEEILESVAIAVKSNYGSVVIQSGEQNSADFANRIDQLIKKIKAAAGKDFRITVACGEQTGDTYRRWFESGAERYLLRIETSSAQLYRSLHPDDKEHIFETRRSCIYKLKDIGYQTGTGVMIGLPGQTVEDLAYDLLFFREAGIDMVGMGPYLEQENTPLIEQKHLLVPVNKRLDMSLKMIAVLRILMKNINIASTGALQAIEPTGREMGILAGANVIMPNLTPVKYRGKYLLYDKKPCLDEDTLTCGSCIETRIKMLGYEIAGNEPGDSLHFKERLKQ